MFVLRGDLEWCVRVRVRVRVMVTGAFVLGYAFSHMYSTGYMYVLDNTRYICPGYMYWITYNIYWVKRLTTCKGIIYL